MERSTKYNEWRTGEWIGIAIIAIAMVAAVFIIAGCGGHPDEAASGASSAVVVASSGAAVAPAQGTSQPQGSASGEGLAAVSADSLPPDVAVAVEDTLVDAGGSVEIKAQGSPDVVAVTLSDGVGKKQPYTYDSASDTWKVFYRVPLRAQRVALSTTATTATHRWRRVWLFLNAHREAQAAAPAETAAPDSSTRP